jgi:glycosyltransferase involved in cell wall biosynthesis
MSIRSEKRSRVAIIAWDGGIGGIQRMLLNFARTVDKEQFEIKYIFLSGQHTLIADQIRALDNSVVVLNWVNAWSVHKRLQLIKLLRDFSPHIIHEHSASVGLAIQYRLLTPIIIRTEHGSCLRRSDVRYLKGRWFDNFFIRTHIAVSSYIAGEYSRIFKISNRRIVVIPNGIWVDEFPVSLSNRNHHTDIRIGFIGRFCLEKGVDDFIAFARLDPLPNASYWLWGDKLDSGSAVLLNTTGNSNGHIHFGGWSEKPADTYAELDLLVFPSHAKESFGLVPLEAIASGVPVVAYATGAIPEILEACPYAELVPTGRIQSLVDASAQLLRKRRDFVPGEMHEWVRKRYDICNHTRRIESVYHKLLA